MINTVSNIQLSHAGAAGDLFTSRANITGLDGMTGVQRQPVHNIGDNLTDGSRIVEAGASVPFVFQSFFHEVQNDNLCQ